MHANPGKLYEHKGLPVILVNVYKHRNRHGDCSVRVIAGMAGWGRGMTSPSLPVFLKDLKRIKRADLALYISLDHKSNLFMDKLKGRHNENDQHSN